MSPENGINPVQFGQLVAQTATLIEQLPRLQSKLESFERRIGDMEGRFRVGKGLAFGLVLGLGFAAYGVKTTLFKLAGID
jgi:hypothetical protein